MKHHRCKFQLHQIFWQWGGRGLTDKVCVVGWPQPAAEHLCYCFFSPPTHRMTRQRTAKRKAKFTRWDTANLIDEGKRTKANSKQGITYYLPHQVLTWLSLGIIALLQQRLPDSKWWQLMGLWSRKHTLVWSLGACGGRNLASGCWGAANEIGAFVGRVRDLLHWAEQMECNHEKNFVHNEAKPEIPRRDVAPREYKSLMEKRQTPAQVSVRYRSICGTD